MSEPPRDYLRLGWGAPAHPKVAILTDAQFRAWIHTLCAAKLQPGGRFASEAHLATVLGRYGRHVTALIDAGLVDRMGGGIGVHDWDEYQVDRQARYRERHRAELAAKEVVAPATTEGGVLAIPDTSALIDVPDLALYPAALGVTEADFYLVPGVLSELDALKDQGRNQGVRDKARAAVRTIRELRQGGSLLEGVEVAPGVRVFSRPQEPQFDGLPGRLDRSVPDDRILAAAFELQREHPTAVVVLVTGDMNMQTKAELARMPFAEPPAKPWADANGESPAPTGSA